MGIGKKYLLLIGMVVVSLLVVLFSAMMSSCGGRQIDDTPPLCATLIPMSDTGMISSRCVAEGVSFGCHGSPSGVELSGCYITDAPSNDFKTLCLDQCP